MECLAKGSATGEQQLLVQSELVTRSQLAGVYYYTALQLQDRPPLSTQLVNDASYTKHDSSACSTQLMISITNCLCVEQADVSC